MGAPPSDGAAPADETGTTDGGRLGVRPDGGSTDRANADGGSTDRANATTGRLRALRNRNVVRSAPFWFPPALLVGLFVYGAVLWNLLISFTGWSGLSQPSYDSLDLAAYQRLVDGVIQGGLLDGPTAYWAVRNTVVLLVVFTVVTLVLGLLLAIMIDRGIRFENTVRTIYLLPMSLSFVVTAIFWAWMYNPQSGMINVILRSVGLGAFAQQWISDPQFKLGAVVFALLWQFSGYAMVVYLAGLRAIPTDQYEAARVDGASTVRLYWKVIVPQLRSSTTSAAVVLMVFGLKAFDFLYVMFGPFPGPSADILSVMMFREAFSNSNWAYGAAIATVLFLMALAVIAPYLWSQFARGEL